MPNRFASQQDYSQTFQYLVEQEDRYLRSAAQRVDAQREAEWAARDALIFTRWQEGKISGNELMAHINMRMSQTSYDKAQQDRWREAAVQYGNAIADERAEAAYAESDNIGALIAHYAGRLANTKKGTPEYTEIATRLKGLRETRTRDNVTDGARRILRKIQKGSATKTDLLKYYQSQASTAKGDLRQEILDNIAELRGQIRQERMSAALLKIDNQVEFGKLTPQQGANEIEALLKKYNVQQNDPEFYQQQQQKIGRLSATPPEHLFIEAQQKVLNGDWSPERYTAFVEKWADRIGKYDQTAKWELIQAGEVWLQDNAAPIEKGGLLDRANQSPWGADYVVDVVNRIKGNAIKFISQFDGSKYNGYNCGMASGAMLAHAMGVEGLSGADLRALSGDTSGGTTVFQVAQALSNKQIGIGAGQLDARSNWDYNDFKMLVQGGAPAVLAGWTGALPPELNSTSGAMGHSVFIAGYDPNKNAFLVLDPSGKGNQQKAWWPADVVKQFAWSGQGWQGGFNGYALVGPVGTIDPKTLQRTGKNVRHVSVTAPPSGRVQGATPITSPTDPPPRTQRKKVADALTDLERRRLRNAGITPGKDLDTKQEVADLLDSREAGIQTLEDTVNEWISLAENGGIEDDGTVEMLDGRRLSEEDINEIQRDLIYMLDGQVILYEANGQKDKANAAKGRRNDVLINAQVVNTLDEDFTENTAIRGAADALDDLNSAQTVQERNEALDRLMDTGEVLAAIDEARSTGGQKTQAEVQADRVGDIKTAAEGAEARQWAKVMEIIENGGDYESSEDFYSDLSVAATDILVRDDAASAFVEQLIATAVQEKQVETGEASYIVIGGAVTVIPMREANIDPETGEPQMVPDIPSDLAKVMDQARLTTDDLEVIIIDGPDGPTEALALPEVTSYEGITMLVTADQPVSDTLEEAFKAMGLEKHIEELTSGRPINADLLADLSPEQIQWLTTTGLATPTDMPVKKLTLNGKTYYENIAIDPATGAVENSWHEDRLPYTPTEPEVDGLKAPGSGYVGTDPNLPGMLVPVQTNDPELLDEAGTGTDVMVFTTDEKAGNDYVQTLVDEGILDPGVKVPNPNNPTEMITVMPGQPLARGTTRPQIAVIQDQKKAEQATRDKLATTMPPEQVQYIDFMTPAELRTQALSMGINPDTGEYMWGDEKGEQAPEDKLKALGIRTQQNAEAAVARYDPLESARQGALAVNKANKAAKAAEQAALAEAKAAMQARLAESKSTSSLPTIPQKESRSSAIPMPDKSKPSGAIPMPQRKPSAPSAPSAPTTPKPKSPTYKPNESPTGSRGGGQQGGGSVSNPTPTPEQDWRQRSSQGR